MWPNWQFIGRLRSYFLKNTLLRVSKMVQSRPKSQNFAFSKNSLVDRSKNKLLSKFKTPMVDRPKQWILKPKYIWVLIIQKRVFHNISEINIKTPSKQYRWYHLNSPPPWAFFSDKKGGGELTWYRDIWYFPLKPVFGLNAKIGWKWGGGN